MGNGNVDRRVGDFRQTQRLPAVVDRQKRRVVASPLGIGESGLVDPDPIEVEVRRVFGDLGKRSSLESML